VNKVDGYDSAGDQPLTGATADARQAESGTELGDRRHEQLTRGQYAENMRQAGPAGYAGGPVDEPSVQDGMQALARYEQARGTQAESRTRTEVAAEARPQVQSAGPDETGEGPVERPDIARRYPAEYIPSADGPPKVDGPHQPPEAWIDGINPDRELPGRDNNCGECSRAVDNTWNGRPAVAAALANPEVMGELPSRMTDWAGTAPVKASAADIGKRLIDLGPGSSAIVGFDWKSGGGHWFNAINDRGTVKAVDGQSGKLEAWPPSLAGVGFDEGQVRWSDAIYFTSDGKVAER